MAPAPLITLLALCWLQMVGCGSAPDERLAPGGSTRARVLRAIDGDTAVMGLDGTEIRVRYIGIDTPESAIPGAPTECFGKQAAAANRRLVEGKSVQLEFDRELYDPYDRLLAYVYRGDAFVNARLVAAGFARSLEIEPNTAHAGELRRAERQAGRRGAGLWKACET